MFNEYTVLSICCDSNLVTGGWPRSDEVARPHNPPQSSAIYNLTLTTPIGAATRKSRLCLAVSDPFRLSPYETRTPSQPVFDSMMQFLGQKGQMLDHRLPDKDWPGVLRAASYLTTFHYRRLITIRDKLANNLELPGTGMVQGQRQPV